MRKKSFDDLDQLYKTIESVFYDKGLDNIIREGISNLQYVVNKFNCHTNIAHIDCIYIRKGAVLANSMARTLICSYITDENKLLDILDYIDNESCVYIQKQAIFEQIGIDYEGDFEEYLNHVAKDGPSIFSFNEKVTSGILDFSSVFGIGLIVQRLWEDSIDLDDLKTIKNKYIYPYENQYGNIQRVRV